VWFWFEHRLPARGGGSELEAALYLASRRLRCQAPDCTTVKAAASEALVLMTMIGLDPVACRWPRRWEAVGPGGQPAYIGKLPLAGCRHHRTKPATSSACVTYWARLLEQGKRLPPEAGGSRFKEVLNMKREETLRELDRLVRSSYPIIYLYSPEEVRVLEALEDLADQQSRRQNLPERVPVWTWSVTTGLVRRYLEGDRFKEEIVEDSQDPEAVLRRILQVKEKAYFVLKDFPPFLQDPLIVRLLRDAAFFLAYRSRATLFLLAPRLVILPDLEKEMVVVDFPLPDEGEMTATLEEAEDRARSKLGVPVELQGPARSRVVRALLGLTSAEASSILARAIITHAALDERAVPLILREKGAIVKRSGVAEFFDTEHFPLEQVGGLDLLKQWAQERERSFTPEARAFGVEPPRGVLMVGVQGCGKSLFCKTLSHLWGLPLLRVDVGALLSSLQGETEEKTRRLLALARALAPVELWLDEVEKGMAGFQSSGQTDAGTMRRVMGEFLTFMQEREEPVFIAATSNDITGLPPEFVQRFDEVFFVDLPTPEERQAILAIHLAMRGRGPEGFDLARVVEATAEFAGRELERVVKDAITRAFNRTVNGGGSPALPVPNAGERSRSKDQAERQMTTEDLLAVARERMPLAATMQPQIQALREWGDRHARRASSRLQEERAAGPGGREELQLQLEV
jgi:hypothetical protein